jgi:uncharacterized membrane protein
MKRVALLAAIAALGACLPHPPPAPAPYRAVGQAEAWTLIIDDKHITWIEPGQTPLTQPVPRVIVGVAGEIYQTPRINVNIVHTPCRETRSDRTYPDTVQVTVDGQQHTGCGGL